MYRYFIQILFDGTNYHGWQIQPNAQSVQQIVNNSLSTVLSEKIVTVGAGRTDTGVHARHFTAHFDHHEPGLEYNTKLLYRINGLLPPDIAVRKLIPVCNYAHARYHALSRTYKYYITNNKDPFVTRYAWHFKGDLDISLMNQAANIIKEHSDFSSFSKLHTSVKTNICTIHKSEWTTKDGILTYTICADRFLRNMVRAIVGTLIQIGRQKYPAEFIREIINSKDRNKAGSSAPAHGLFLYHIDYPEEIFI